MANQFFLTRFCVSSLLWRDRPIGDVARSMMRLGLTHLELSGAPLASGHYRPDENNSRLFNVLAESGVSVSALRLTEMRRQQKLRAITDAGARGIPTVIDRVEHLGYPDLIDRVRLYATYAAQAGVQFVLENDLHTSCDNAEAQNSLARNVRQRSLGFGFSPFSAVADGKDPGEEVRTLGPGLRMAYLWEAPMYLAEERLYQDVAAVSINSGPAGREQVQMDWADYFQALAGVGFRGMFGLKWERLRGWTPGQTEAALIQSVRFYTSVAEQIGLGK